MLNPSSFFMDAINKNKFSNNKLWNPRNESWRLVSKMATGLVHDKSPLSQSYFIYLYIFQSSQKKIKLNRREGAGIGNSLTCLTSIIFFNILFYFLKFN